MNMKQLDLFNTNKEYNELIKIKDGEYIYIPNFFNKQKSDIFYQSLLNEIKWKQQEMNMYGKVVKFPRLTAWYGDINKKYSFSGIHLTPTIWTNELLEIKKAIEPKCNVSFNSVLLNQYRDGNDSISWHTDAEKELGKNPLIASVNFGETRKFQLKHNETNEKIEIELKHGSLLIMKGELQHFWKHQIPKTKKKIGNRINLTFRIIK
ncbi:alpha-ketoglutarate-dependent dioxygenase AlkB [Tenacibaculum finnmarkense]|uniref:alpha-ketoglutarate-dependent dioxygenase AlkB family protein n=1 Tax=Tenacibaculum finnmarkense TaxID=2781243 RepID=UPI000C5A0160|nr:alpha-ketoglutarate-dependent dioxygenase AlkB [Tenacibaculum finnmarkense]MCD8429982.1 alpha-ketoglutarate-dependent dioxygenase AlkB [Tenacibaculum finnmarkense genomovar ulcerans]MCD8432551.1 alpha-ketoglutarate-dependent dioxygenase AlkB [Tenacibaculum finnmarkense genomovar ulcerans]SOS51474.1 Alkylated DNA repair dioxygenase AlkB [Tenacibaculum finnmarkense]